MTIQEVATMVESIGLPYAYYQFPDNTQQYPPFVVFFFTGDDDFKADNINYSKINRLTVELYSDDKEFYLESRIANILTENGFTFSRSENYIDSERMWQISYDMEVIINAE